MCSRSREKDKHGRAKVRNPAREEKSRSCLRQISGIECERAGMNKVARVIQHHHYHHDATQQVDRIDPSTRSFDRCSISLCGHDDFTTRSGGLKLLEQSSEYLQSSSDPKARRSRLPPWLPRLAHDVRDGMR